MFLNAFNGAHTAEPEAGWARRARFAATPEPIVATADRDGSAVNDAGGQ
jgi:hypothetical protein